MKMIAKTENRTSILEKYDFDDFFSKSLSRKGVSICYLLATNIYIDLVSVELKSQDNYQKYSRNSFINKFDSMDKFVNVYSQNDGKWLLKAIFNDVQMTIYGLNNSSEIGVLYSNIIKINLFSLFERIEITSYEFNEFDKKVLNVLQNDYLMSTKKAVKTIERLKEYDDIYHEFATSIVKGDFPDDKSGLVVNGYSAKKLGYKYKLCILGAYRFLTDLRKNPSKTLSSLKHGCDRKHEFVFGR